MPETAVSLATAATCTLGHPKLDAYVELLAKWSRIHNLAGGKSTTDFQQLVRDCDPLVAAAGSTTTGSLCDIGSGAGMPGVMLAIAEPSRSVTLIESESSKCAFLEQVRITLGLANVTIVHCRSEDWKPVSRPKVICCRAVSSLPKLIGQCKVLIEPGTVVMALKAKDPNFEVAELLATGAWRVLGVTATDSEPSRHLVRLEACS